MFDIFGGGIGREFSRAYFDQLPRRDQNAALQHVYDQEYSIPEISKYIGIPAPTLYGRINAHRGRGSEIASAA